ELIRAMQYLPENTLLFITGPRDRPEPEVNKPSIYDGLRQEIDRLGLKRRVFLLGMVPDALMGPLMSLPHGDEKDQFHIAIVASASRQEGWGMAVQDGTRGGMPLVATDFTPYAMHLDRTNKAAMIVSLKQGEVPKRFASAIQRLIDNPPEARAMAEKALAIAAQYEWGPLTARFILQLGNIIHGARELYPSIAAEQITPAERAESESPPVNLVVLAGGIGRRFEPYSTEDRPKQFLQITSKDSSMLQQTIDRFRSTVPAQRIWVATNARYMDKVKEQVPDLPDANIVGEPMMRNTAPAIATLMYRLAARDPNSVAVIVPSDHYIEDPERFLSQVAGAVSFAVTSGGLITFGIDPTLPSPEYGYIKRGTEVPGSPGVYRVENFVEKPSVETAQQYLESRDYYWNSGMFVWGTQAFLRNLAIHQPVMHAGLEAVYGGQPADVPLSQRLLTSYFEPLTPKSIDYALMEPAADAGRVAVLPFDREGRNSWSDVGTWASLGRLVDAGKVDPPEAVMEHLRQQQAAGGIR
ncbi:MAG: sugar phosphate nucleotidyltransferase, partial [bacterium]